MLGDARETRGAGARKGALGGLWGITIPLQSSVLTLGHCFHWQQEAEVNLRKAKQIYMQRSEEHDKAKYMAVKAEEEQQNTTSSITTKTLDKKRRLEEEAKNKVGRWQLWTSAERLPGKNVLTPCCPRTGAALS